MGNMTTDVPILLLLIFSAVKPLKSYIVLEPFYGIQVFLAVRSYFSNNVQETTTETAKSKLQVPGNARMKFQNLIRTLYIIP